MQWPSDCALLAVLERWPVSSSVLQLLLLLLLLHCVKSSCTDCCAHHSAHLRYKIALIDQYTG
jgi:hypothetical protein